MPAKTTLFDVRANATHSFALSPRNTILFSPDGRFVLVAGFGNLAGQMDIYDLEKDHRHVCSIEASNASVCEWSPDGKHILTATTSPRLRVDNGVRIWHVGGGLMYNEDLQELYNVAWRPQSLSIRPTEDPFNPLPTPHASALAYLGTIKTPSKSTGAYRPPGARGQITPLAFRREDEGGAAYVSNGSLSLGSGVNGFGKSRKRDIPGAEAAPETDRSGPAPDADDSLSKAALKNKKKREAKKAKEVADKAAGLAPTTNGTPPGAKPSPCRSPERRNPSAQERSRSKGHMDARPRSQQRVREMPSIVSVADSRPTQVATSTPLAQQAQAETPNVIVNSSGTSTTPQDKKLRALLKKLRAIDDLKMRRAGGEKLEGTQIKKMETEEEVRRELEGLGWTE